MPQQIIAAAQLDFLYSDECPACGDEAGWTGDTELRANGSLGLLFACPKCGNQFATFWIKYNEDFAAVPKPVHTPGRKKATKRVGSAEDVRGRRLLVG
jgi:hypothetical protein